MRALAILLIFSGYTLVYAAVAKGGRFTTDPWAGLFADAYTSSVVAADVGAASQGAGSTIASVASTVVGTVG